MIYKPIIIIIILFLHCTDPVTIEDSCCCNGDSNLISITPDIVTVDDGDIFSENISITTEDSINIVSIYLEISYNTLFLELVQKQTNTDSISNPFFNNVENVIVSDDTLIIDSDGWGTIVIGLLGQGDGYTGSNGSGNIVDLQFQVISPIDKTLIKLKTIEIYSFPVENPPILIDDYNSIHAIIFGS